MGVEEAPSMYEMEGASAPSAATARSLGPRNRGAAPPSPGRALANPGRLGVHLPERRHSRMARQFGGPCRELSARTLALANTRPSCLLTGSEVSLRTGPPSLAACKICSPAGPLSARP